MWRAQHNSLRRYFHKNLSRMTVPRLSWWHLSFEKGWERDFEREREKEGCSSKNLYTGCYSGIGRRTDKGWAWRSARFLWYWLQPPIQVHKQGQIYPSPRLHPPSSLSHLLFPIQRSPPRFHPLSHFYPPIFFLLSTLLPRFASLPTPPITVTSCWHISFPASWLTCEPSRITGEQSH